MDQRLENTASDWVNHFSQEELAKVLWEYGGSEWARKIARAIVEERRKMPIRTTAVPPEESLPGRSLHGSIPDGLTPPPRTFQALRITTKS